MEDGMIFSRWQWCKVVGCKGPTTYTTKDVETNLESVFHLNPSMSGALYRCISVPPGAHHNGLDTCSCNIRTCDRCRKQRSTGERTRKKGPENICKRGSSMGGR